MKGSFECRSPQRDAPAWSTRSSSSCAPWSPPANGRSTAGYPPSPNWSQRLGVGRNTVREAIRALAHNGIFEVRQGDGTYVRATSEVSAALRRLCGSELRDVLQVRRCLEVEGARLAATARTEEDLAELRAQLAHTDITDHAQFTHSDTEFHLAVVRASHNPVLIEIYRGLLEAITASVATTSAAPGGMFRMTSWSTPSPPAMWSAPGTRPPASSTSCSPSYRFRTAEQPPPPGTARRPSAPGPASAAAVTTAAHRPAGSPAKRLCRRAIRPAGPPGPGPARILNATR